MTRALATALERIATAIGLAVAWIGIPLVVVSIALEPILRWTGSGPDLPLGEISTLAFLAVTMTSFGYAYAPGAHVRLDVLSRRYSRRANAAIELAGTVLVLIPLCAVVVVNGVDSTWLSFQQGERWGDTTLALQWVVRSWVPVGFALLMAAGIASGLRALLIVLRK